MFCYGHQYKALLHSLETLAMTLNFNALLCSVDKGSKQLMREAPPPLRACNENQMSNTTPKCHHVIAVTLPPNQW
jgi:hypothetical protein